MTRFFRTSLMGAAAAIMAVACGVPLPTPQHRTESSGTNQAAEINVGEGDEGAAIAPVDVASLASNARAAITSPSLSVEGDFETESSIAPPTSGVYQTFWTGEMLGDLGRPGHFDFPDLLSRYGLSASDVIDALEAKDPAGLLAPTKPLFPDLRLRLASCVKMRASQLRLSYVVLKRVGANEDRAASATSVFANEQTGTRPVLKFSYVLNTRGCGAAEFIRHLNLIVQIKLPDNIFANGAPWVFPDHQFDFLRQDQANGFVPASAPYGEAVVPGSAFDFIHFAFLSDVWHAGTIKAVNPIRNAAQARRWCDEHQNGQSPVADAQMGALCDKARHDEPVAFNALAGSINARGGFALTRVSRRGVVDTASLDTAGVVDAVTAIGSELTGLGDLVEIGDGGDAGWGVHSAQMIGLIATVESQLRSNADRRLPRTPCEACKVTCDERGRTTVSCSVSVDTFGACNVLTGASRIVADPVCVGLPPVPAPPSPSDPCGSCQNPIKICPNHNLDAARILRICPIFDVETAWAPRCTIASQYGSRAREVTPFIGVEPSCNGGGTGEDPGGDDAGTDGATTTSTGADTETGTTTGTTTTGSGTTAGTGNDTGTSTTGGTDSTTGGSTGNDTGTSTTGGTGSTTGGSTGNDTGTSTTGSTDTTGGTTTGGDPPLPTSPYGMALAVVPMRFETYDFRGYTSPLERTSRFRTVWESVGASANAISTPVVTHAVDFSPVDGNMPADAVQSQDGKATSCAGCHLDTFAKRPCDAGEIRLTANHAVIPTNFIFAGSRNSDLTTPPFSYVGPIAIPGDYGRALILKRSLGIPAPTGANGCDARGF